MIKGLLLSTFVLALCWLPYLPIFLERLRNPAESWREIPGLGAFWTTFWTAFNKPVPAFIYVCSIGLWILVSRPLKLKNSRESLHILGYGMLILCLIIGVSQFTPIYMFKYTSFLFPFFYLIAAYVIWQLLSIIALRSAVLLFFLPMAFTTELQHDFRRDVHVLVENAEEFRSENRAVMILPAHWYLTYSYHAFPGSFKSPEVQQQMKDHGVYPCWSHKEIQQALTRFDELLFIALTPADRDKAEAIIRNRPSELSAPQVVYDHDGCWMILSSKTDI